jgi:hypothetical protein
VAQRASTPGDSQFAFMMFHKCTIHCFVLQIQQLQAQQAVGGGGGTTTASSGIASAALTVVAPAGSKGDLAAAAQAACLGSRIITTVLEAADAGAHEGHGHSSNTSSAHHDWLFVEPALPQPMVTQQVAVIPATIYEVRLSFAAIRYELLCVSRRMPWLG